MLLDFALVAYYHSLMLTCAASRILGVLVISASLGSPPGEEVVPAERNLSRTEIYRATEVPHPYAASLAKTVASTMGKGTLWGKYRDPEDGRRYVGHDACRPCHYGLNRSWAETKMAAALKKLADFNGGKYLNDARCLSCHTTGYDPGRENGGFDEGVQFMADVQCESCHGAGSLMVADNDRKSIIRTLDSDLCGRCHSERFGSALCFPEYDEWKTSRHARALETLQMSPRADDSCLECHSADAIAPPSDRTPTVINATTGVTCQACHDAMARTFPELPDNNQLRHPKKDLCQWCHSLRRKTTDGVPHAPQADMFLGTGGAQFPGESYQSGPMNADIVRGCLACHAVSDRSIARPYQGHAFLPNILACRRCHPDLSTFDRKGVQGEIRRLLLKLEGKLAAYPPGAGRGESFRKALFNYQFVSRDRSFGIHNSDYARKLLTDSIRFLGQDNP